MPFDKAAQRFRVNRFPPRESLPPMRLVQALKAFTYSPDGRALRMIVEGDEFECRDDLFAGLEAEKYIVLAEPKPVKEVKAGAETNQKPEEVIQPTPVEETPLVPSEEVVEPKPVEETPVAATDQKPDQRPKKAK